MSGTGSIIHPAYEMPFVQLLDGLNAACAAGMVRRKDDPATGRTLYCYSERCVYENGWNEFSLLARGIILHAAEQRIVAAPFPKFFNIGERGSPVPDLPFETFEKVDGSLAIIHHSGGRWRVATKGAFDSAQAAWSEARLKRHDTSALQPGATYLAEAIYPENRIVVYYDRPELVLLGAYKADGTEIEHAELVDVAAALGWRTAKRHSYQSFRDMVETATALPATEEGFVVRFANGLRLKVKGAEYRRIHSLISRCTPLAIWEAMAAGDDMERMRRDLPEEFLGDFDAILARLSAQVTDIRERIAVSAKAAEGLTDKELGLSLHSLPEDVRSFVFPYRRAGGKIEGKPLQSLYRAVRPTGNVLDGYAPSYAMKRVMDDAA